jgi:hypothetical protein
MTSPVLIRKDVAALPAIRTPNTIYIVRRSLGFDLHITDNTGNLVFKLNNSDDPLRSPTFTYTSGTLTGITYEDGSSKTLTYAGDQLQRIDLLRGGITYRKQFNYSGQNLVSITETLI